MNLIGELAAKGNLLIPKKLLDRYGDDKKELKKRFYKALDDFIYEHESEKDPYFVLFKGCIDPKNPTLSRQAFSYYMKRPPLLTNSIVFFVDNSRGNIITLWQVDGDKNIEWNTSMEAKLRETLRSRAAV